MGRPSDFTQEIADAICERLADGESLRSICLSDDMPSKTSVFRWLTANETFRDQYASAREAQADAFVDEMVDIADDTSRDFKTKTNSDGEEYEVADTDHIQRSKVRIDTRKWVAARMQPKKYGDKVTNEVTGKDGTALIPEATPTDMAKALLAVLARGAE